MGPPPLGLRDEFGSFPDWALFRRDGHRIGEFNKADTEGTRGRDGHCTLHKAAEKRTAAVFFHDVPLLRRYVGRRRRH